MKTMIVPLGIIVLCGGCTFNITFNITGTVPARPGSSSAKAEEGAPHVYPAELQAGDIVIDDRGDEWELTSRATRVAGSRDFGATVRRVDGPAGSPPETREARWRAHERVQIRRSGENREATGNP